LRQEGKRRRRGNERGGFLGAEQFLAAGRERSLGPARDRNVDEVLVLPARQDDEFLAGRRSDDLRLSHIRLTHRCSRAGRRRGR
jgi:hypothetical protein